MEGLVKDLNCNRGPTFECKAAEFPMPEIEGGQVFSGHRILINGPDVAFWVIDSALNHLKTTILNFSSFFLNLAQKLDTKLPLP